MVKTNNIWISCLIVFVASACTLIIELVAGRIMAPYVGVSLYTWTSIIGVVLAGISLGNYFGGQIADRWGSRRTLGVLLLLSGILSVGILGTIELLNNTPFALPLVAKILFLCTAIFFPPSCLLGTISPVVVKLSLENLERAGNIVGKIYAVSALGSIFGTFLTGFVLISWLGTRSIIFIVAVVLVVMAVVFGDWRRARIDLAVLLVIALGLGWYLYDNDKLQSPYLMETNYFSIRVGETEMADKTIRKELILDHLIHSYSWVDEPTRLEYGYEKVYAEVTSYIARRHANPDAMFIGGGGYTFPRYMEVTYPGSRIDVAEIDPGVTEIAYSHLGLKRDTRIKTFNGDARLFFDENGKTGTKYNLIMGDAFNDLSLPYHLTTHEFNQKVKRALQPDGYYMVNVIDNYKTGEFMRAFINTLKKTFRHVYLIGLGQAWESDGSSTYVVLGGDEPLDVEEFKRIATENNTKQMTGAIMPNDQLEEYLQKGRKIILTDDYTPIDNLMAPLFVERGY